MVLTFTKKPTNLIVNDFEAMSSPILLSTGLASMGLKFSAI